MRYDKKKDLNLYEIIQKPNYLAGSTTKYCITT